MNYKKTNASKTTVSRDLYGLSKDVGNVYETIAILAKRSRQISLEMKEELLEKINEFSTVNNSLEEVFENKEQIEVSRYYERLPKSTSIAIQELQEGKIYHRAPEKKEESEVNMEELGDNKNDLKATDSTNESK
jgi:DNA-directed RNA polymerase subunit K/omega